MNLKDIAAKLRPLIDKARRSAVPIFVVTVAAMFGFLVYRIGQLAQIEPHPNAVSEKLQTVTRPKLDQDAVNKIQALEDTNIEVRSLFQQARDNPFKE